MRHMPVPTELSEKYSTSETRGNSSGGDVKKIEIFSNKPQENTSPPKEKLTP